MLDKKLAALLVYCKWSWLESHPDKCTYEYPPSQKLNFFEFENHCPWCELYFSTKGAGTTICTGCPLDELGEKCVGSDVENSLFKESRKFSVGDKTFLSRSEIEEIKRKSRVAAGEIARIAWAEYKKLGG